jgi:WD40 repeat protein
MGECVHTLGHSSRVRSAHFSSDGQSIVTADQDKTVRVWDLRVLTDIQNL